ncbi:MAG: DEAD/DEAH box helicase family protein [Rothia sp. (in: high G+C Gram-positive bacteria)]|nr:DEAD/DEAH box helicase family protein [Rothia sp. (in: high G+C Gram-positive bacteria)]
MPRTHLERPFQKEICAHLAEHGWEHSPSDSGYDAARALFPADLLEWLKLSDPQNYERVVNPAASAAEQAKAEERILDSLVRTLNEPETHGGGTLNVLRKGFKVLGARRAFKVLQLPPQDHRNPELTELFQQNILRVVEEVHAYPNQPQKARVDLVFFCNGLPVATAELKSEYAQTLQEAIKQYKQDRDPKHSPLLQEHRGALVHFALSQDEIYMTTRLEGRATTFLPFNKGNNHGAGNPINPEGAATSYFWEEILQRDTWITILSKFIYTNHERKTDPLTGRPIHRSQIRFPRYHQWRAVTKLIAAAKEEGPGHKYLIQHSAGSGKTDSIAWTAHRLATLHNNDGEKIFDSVIVIADRQVLDRQLQDAVDQLVTATGTFQPITRNGEGSKAQQLTEALVAGVQIIGVTLQTFPYALEEIEKEGSPLAGKRFAVIADEAHSSQSGKATESIKKLLYQGAEIEPEEDEDTEETEAHQEAINTMAVRLDANHRISFFAFTATPKEKTLKIFGRRPSSDAPLEPFDLYPMKQAIEEGFILDVLKNYTTYEMAARIGQKIDGDEPVEDEFIDLKKGAKTFIRFVELHPTNIASKVSIILDHYIGTVKNELGGKAKAMVVTSSREAAVRYHRALEKEITERGLPLHTLVAFSGELPDPDIPALNGAESPAVTETSENPSLKGRDLAEVFAQDDQHILIVANKYQTGFDQPLLVAMYVDKKLSGITAVQTLSRLNRRASGKDNTYVLDFVNDPEQIVGSFREYYTEAKIRKESDLELIAKQVAKLDNAGIYTLADVEQFWQQWIKTDTRPTSFDGLVRVPQDRFKNRWEQAKENNDKTELETLIDFRATLSEYVTAYAFFAQIFDFGDPYFEELSAFADLLGRRLRKFTLEENAPEQVDVDDVILTHYRLEKMREEEDLRINEGSATGLTGITEAGMAQVRERERKTKSVVIEKINQYFQGLELGDEYKVGFVSTMVAEIAKDTRLQSTARSNTKVDFAYSNGLRVAIEDKLWQYEEGTDEVVKYARQMPVRDLLNLFLEMGLYERLVEDDGTSDNQPKLRSV